MAGSEPNTSDDSTSTVELEINQSPPPRMTLRSHAKKTPSSKPDEGQEADVDEPSKDEEPSRKKRQNKKQSKHISKSKKSKVAFQLHSEQLGATA